MSIFRSVLFNCSADEISAVALNLVLGPVRVPPLGFFDLSVVDVHSLVQCWPLPYLLNIPERIDSLLECLVFFIIYFAITLFTTVWTFASLDFLTTLGNGFSC